MKILTIGTFDIPHLGHYNLINQIQKLFPFADIVVSVNSDDFVEAFKGHKPIFSQQERKDYLRLIDGVVVVDNRGGEFASVIINEEEPDILVIGSDWLKKDYLKQLNITPEYLESRKITLVYVPYTEGISTTEIKKRLNETQSGS